MFQNMLSVWIKSITCMFFYDNKVNKKLDEFLFSVNIWKLKTRSFEMVPSTNYILLAFLLFFFFAKTNTHDSTNKTCKKVVKWWINVKKKRKIRGVAIILMVFSRSFYIKITTTTTMNKKNAMFRFFQIFFFLFRNKRTNPSTFLIFLEQPQTSVRK